MSFPAGALTTTPNAAIPYNFRRRTSPHGDEKMTGAGVVFHTKDGKGLFLKRSDKSDHPGEWCFPGGGVQQDEEPHDAARRETLEEIGRLPRWEVAPLHRETSQEGVDFVTFAQSVDVEFEPTLNDEHSDHVWAPFDAPPQPLHPGVAKLLAKFFGEEAKEQPHEKSGAARELEHEFADDQAPPDNQSDPELKVYETGNVPKGELQGVNDSALTLALDRESVRTVDQDGHLHIAETNVCKACVSPYRGSEIPDWENLGLQPDKIYQMLRPPEELEKAVDSINGKPLLRNHVPVSADDHKEKEVAGAVGTNARWEHPFIKNSLTIWPEKDIHGVETKQKYQLSPGYHYRAVMEPGTFDGEPYDGKMVDISFNHVALVSEGRQGPDVVVGDAALKEKAMKPTRLEYLAVTRAAAALNPQLAFDAKVEYGPIFKGLTMANLKQRKVQIVGDVKKALAGKTIAKDASVEGLAKLLDHLEHVEEPKSLDESVSEKQHKAMEAAAHGHSNLGIPKKVGEEFEKADKGKSFDWEGWASKHGVSKDAMAELPSRHKDEMPENALDEEEENVNIEVEEGEDGEIEEEEAEDEIEEEEGEDEIEFEEGEDEIEFEEGEEGKKKAKDKKSARDKSAKDKHAKDKAKDSKHAKDKRMGTDAKTVTVDEMNKAIGAAVASANKNARETAEAREFVRPIVGELPLALDSAEKVYRSAAKILNIEDAETVHASALKTIIKMQPKAGAQPGHGFSPQLAADSASAADFNTRFPGAARIGAV